MGSQFNMFIVTSVCNLSDRETDPPFCSSRHQIVADALRSFLEARLQHSVC